MRKNLFSILMFIFGLAFMTLTIVYAFIDTEILKFIGAISSSATLMLFMFMISNANWKGKDKSE